MKRQRPSPPARAPFGFSLVELTIVLIVASLLVGGLLVSLAARHESLAIIETQYRLNEARDALLGFAAANGRLPCPAGPETNGIESPPGGGKCTHHWNGFLPAVTLGLTATNDKGFAIDAWSQPIRYAVTADSNTKYCPGPCFTTANAIRTAWAAGASLSPDLHVCTSSKGTTQTNDGPACTEGFRLASSAVAVLYSRGSNGGVTPNSDDERANEDGDRLFISHLPTPSGKEEFDDLVIWLSPNILFTRMIAAGRLP